MSGKLLALTGLAGSGKTTIAQVLADHGAQRVRFAGVLKDMLRTMGLTEAQVDGDEKELPCELLGGKTPRDAMQTLGTEWGRQLIDSDLWVRCTMAKVDALRDSGTDVVLDDCRFDNEALAVCNRGGIVVKLYRPGLAAFSAHASEAGINAKYVHAVVRNNSIIEAVTGVQTALRYRYE